MNDNYSEDATASTERSQKESSHVTLECHLTQNTIVTAITFLSS